MTRTLLLSVALLATATAAGAQGTTPIPVQKDPAPHAMHAGEHTSGWTELDAYHQVMMAVWHPAKATNDLAPIRARAGALAASADTLARSAVPAACDTPATRTGVAAVARESRALADLVARNGTDAEIKPALALLHDRFETVNRACSVKGAGTGAGAAHKH